MSVAERLKELRDSKGLSMEEMLDVLEIKNTSSISRWENNQAIPRPKIIKRYAEYFRVDEDWIKYGNKKIEVGKRLKQLRNKKRLTQEEVSKIVGASDRSVIANWERGKTVPKTQYIKEYAKYFEVSEDWILQDDDVDINERLSLLEAKVDKILEILEERK